MHVSRKADYAVRALAYIAGQDGRRVLIAEIATAMAMPQAFLSKVMKELVGGGLLVSQPGPGGGYQLHRPAEEISFRHIIELVEGTWNLVPCQGDDAGDACLLHANCQQVGVWDAIRQQMLVLLDARTLDEVKEPLASGSAGSELLPLIR